MEFLVAGSYQASFAGTLASRLDSTETAASLMMHAGPQTGMCKAMSFASDQLRPARPVVALMRRSSLVATRKLHIRASATQTQANRVTGMSSAFQAISVSTWVWGRVFPCPGAKGRNYRCVLKPSTLPTLNGWDSTTQVVVGSA